MGEASGLGLAAGEESARRCRAMRWEDTTAQIPSGINQKEAFSSLAFFSICSTWRFLRPADSARQTCRLNQCQKCSNIVAAL